MRKLRLEGTPQDKLAYLESLDYEVLIRRRNGRYHLVIEELPVVADGPDVASAHAELERRKTALLRGLLEAGAEDEIEPPRSYRGGELRRLALLGAKTAVVCALAGVAVAMTGRELSRQFENVSLSRLVKRNASMLAGEAEKFVSVPAETKAERLKAFRKTADELRPFVEEARKAWEPRSPKR